MKRFNEMIGPYSIIRKLGEGGMGTVFLVESPETCSRKAVKVLKPVFAETVHAQRFRREFRVLQALEHPGIVKVEKLVSEDDLNYFVMEYVPGETLKTVIRRDFHTSKEWIRNVMTWMADTCNILSHIHGKQIVHRDLKPSNIMVLNRETYPRVKLLDFGLVRWIEPDVSITESSIIVGSMMYMAPEQALNSGVDSRADIYALGVIFYEALAGVPPFQSEFPRALIGMHRLRVPERPRKRNPSIPPLLDDLVMSMLAKRPEDRPVSVQNIESVLNRMLERTEAGGVLLEQATGLLYEPIWVGHEPGLEVLKNEWHKAMTGKLVVMLVQGEPGIGKSRLIDEFLQDPELVNRVVPRVDSMEGDLFLGAIQRALRKALDKAHRHRWIMDSMDHDEYQRLNDLLDTFDEIGKEGGISGIKEMSIKYLQIFKTLYKTSPIILVVEDMHESEAGLLMILEQIIRQMGLRHRYEDETQGLYFIFTIREGDALDLSRWQTFLEKIGRIARLKTLTLNRLSPSFVSTMVESILGSETDSRLIRLVAEHSEGVPLFVREIVRDLVESKAVYNDNGVWRLHREVEWCIPHKMRTIFSRRLARFGKTGEKILSVAAVLGREFKGRIHEEICDMKEEEYLDIMDELIRAGIFEEPAGKPDVYRFSHAKLRETVLDNMSPRRLKFWHKRTAEILSRIYHDKREIYAEVLAYHFEKAGKFTQAYPLRWVAAEKALNKGAQQPAVEQVYKAAGILAGCRYDPGENLRERKRIYLTVGRLERRLGHFRRAKEYLNKALTLGKDEGDDTYLGEVLLHLGALYGMQGDRDRTLKILNRALNIFEQQNNLQLSADCLTNIGAALSAASEDDASLPYHERALEISRKLNDEKRLARCLLNMAFAHLALNSPEKALSFFRESLAVAGKRKDKRLMAFNLIGIVTYYIGFDLNAVTARRVMMITKRVIETVRETGDRAMLADCLYKRARAAQYLGLPFTSEIEKSFAIARDLGIKWLIQSIVEWKSGMKGGESSERGYQIL